MRIKNTLFLVFGLFILLFSTPSLHSQTVDFDSLALKPGIFEGISEPKSSEAEALLDARNSAFRNLAASISSFVSGNYDISQISNGTDAVVVTISGEARVTVRLPLFGVEEVGKKIERTENGYIARVLVTISKENLEKSKQYADRELTAFRAYNYFAQRVNISPVSLTNVPDGYIDYQSWLDTNCLVFVMQGDRHDYLVPLDTFLRKLFRTIHIFDENQIKIMYNIPDRYDDIITALQKYNIRVIRENSHLVLIPGISLEEFKNLAEKMPDAREILISGINYHDNRNTHISSLILNETAHITEQNFSMHTNVVRLPDQCLSVTYNDTEIINMLDKKTARYVLLLRSTANLEPGIEAYKIPSHFRISYRCILFDTLTEKSIYSAAIHDVDFSSVDGSGANGRIPAGLYEMLAGVLENL